MLSYDVEELSTFFYPDFRICFLQIYAVDNGYVTAEDFTETSVRVKRLGPRQLGKYLCRAQNKLGSSEKEFVIQESYEPNCVVGLCGDFSSGCSEFKSLFSMLITMSILLVAVK